MDTKASKILVGNLIADINSFRLDLNPLLERKVHLKDLIAKVKKFEINVTNEKDFNKQLEQMSYKLKDTNDNLND